MLAAVDEQRSGVALGFAPRSRARGFGCGCRLTHRLGDERVVVPRGNLAVLDKDRLIADRGGEVTELGAGQLEERWGCGRAAPTLEEGQGGHEIGRWGGGRIEFNAQGDRVACSGGGQIGWKEETEHGCRKRFFPE